MDTEQQAAEIERIRGQLAITRALLDSALEIIKSECETTNWLKGEAGQLYTAGRRLLDEEDYP